MTKYKLSVRKKQVLQVEKTDVASSAVASGNISDSKGWYKTRKYGNCFSFTSFVTFCQIV